MSDWKSRATPVATEGWKARAKQNSADRAPFEGIPAEPIQEEPDWFAPKSLTGTALRSANEGLSFGFSGEIGGALGAADELGRRQRAFLGATGPDSVPVESAELSLKDALVARYRREREDSDGELTDGARANPGVAFGAEMAGLVLAPNPLGKVSGAARMIGGGAALGGVAALGKSEADLTQGDLGGAAADTGAGALTGGATAAALMPAAKGIGVLSEKLRSRARGVRADKMGKIEEALDKEIASAKGSFDSATQAGHRTHENIQRAAGGMENGGLAVVQPDTQHKAMLALSDPEFRALADTVANNTIDNVGNRLATVNRARSKYEGLASARDATAQSQFDSYFATPVMGSEVTPRLWRAAGGAAIGATGGAALGGINGLVDQAQGGDGWKTFRNSVSSGIALGAFAGGSGTKTMARNFAKSPRVQNAALMGVAEHGATAALAPQQGIIAAAAQRTQEALRRPKDQQDEDAVSALLNGAW